VTDDTTNPITTGSMLANAGPADPDNPHAEHLKRLDLIILTITGLVAGGILYYLTETALDDPRLLALVGSTTFAAIASFIVLWSRERLLHRLVITLAMAALIGFVTWLVAGTAVEGEETRHGFTATFWIFPSVPLVGFLGLVFGRVWLEGNPQTFAYSRIFHAGLDLPLQWAVGALLGGGVTLFVFLWAHAFEAAGWYGLKAAFDDGWIVMPLAGGVTALATGLARSVSRMRSALEAIILIGAKIALPLLAVFSALFAVAVIIGGMESLKVAGSPTAILLSLAIAAMLIFNGVYRDGHEAPGPFMRSFVWVTLATLPVYATLAAHGIFIRVQEYGFTPSRFVVMIVTGLIALYTLLLLISLVGDILRRRDRDWMPLVARLNTGFAAVWLILLVSFQLPFLSPDAYSANDQIARLIDGRTIHDKFDYTALRFDMGQPGRDAINALAELTDHPDVEQINAAAIEMRDRASRWPDAPVATPDPIVDNAFSQDILQRIDTIQAIGLEEARASHHAALTRLQAAQALLCELQTREDITDAERQWAEARLRTDITHDLFTAEHTLARYGEPVPQAAEVDRYISTDDTRQQGRWSPSRMTCQADKSPDHAD